jgi:hypothetical protein
MDTLRNFAYSGVQVPPVPPNLGTSMTVYPGTSSRFPAAPFSVSVWPVGQAATPANAEIIRVTAVAGDVWTLQRQQEGTAARPIELNDQIAQALTVKTITDLVADLKAYTDAKVAAIPLPPPTTYVPPRVLAVTSAPAVTPNCDLHDAVTINALAEAIGIQNPIGTPEEMQPLVVRIRDNGTARAVYWGDAYMTAAYVQLPAATAVYKTLHCGFRYNALYVKWHLVALTQEP